MTKPKPEKEAVYIAIQGFTMGPQRVVGKGARLLGSDPAVRKFPQWFYRDGATDEEISRAINEAGLTRLAGS